MAHRKSRQAKTQSEKGPAGGPKAPPSRRGEDRRFQVFLDDAPDAMVVADRQGGIAYVNHRTESLFGWDRAALIGKPIDVVLPLRFRRTYRARMQRYFAGLVPYTMSQRFELCGVTQDGLEVPIEVSLARVATVDGIMVSAVIRDISKSVAAQENLSAARDAALAASEAKSRFLAVASHDLRQPLQSLKFLQGVLSRKIVEPEMLEVVRKLGVTLAAMGDALDALLDLNQLETGTIKPAIDNVPVGPILSRLRTELDHRASEKGLWLHVVDCSATVRSDPRLLAHLVQNLIENAVKYTDSGGVLIGCRRRGRMLSSRCGIPAWVFRKAS